VRGRTNRQIGSQLFISEKTGSVDVSDVLDKLRFRPDRGGNDCASPRTEPSMTEPRSDLVRRKGVRVLIKRVSSGLVFLFAMAGGLGLGFLAVRLLSNLSS